MSIDNNIVSQLSGNDADPAEHAERKTAESRCCHEAHEHTHDHSVRHNHERVACCCHDHAGSSTRAASDTLAIYHIEAMDCPVEEQLIRDRLAPMDGVEELTFDLKQRILLVRHHLKSTEALVEALRDLEMNPKAVATYTPEARGCAECEEAGTLAEIDYEALGTASDTRAIYRILNMDCPVEEALIRKKLTTIQGITHLDFNLMQRVLTVDHTLSSTKPIEDALNAIDMAPEPICQNATSVFSVSGMCSPAEETMVRAKLKETRGIFSVQCNMVERTVTITHTPGSLPAISTALASLNMGARLLVHDQDDAGGVPQPKIPWQRLICATVLAALAEGAELMHDWGAAPGLDAIRVGTWPLLEILSVLFAVLAIALSGIATYKKGWLSISNRALNMNALMSVAVTGAVFIGQYPEAAMVMVLFNISEAIEARALDKARNAIKELLALAPVTATVQREDGSWQEVNVREVAVGSRVRVRPGEKIALDGKILAGHSAVNQAPITGESMPVDKNVGDQVYAGTINLSGSFEFETTTAAHDSTLARIINAVEEAQGTRAPIQRFVDTFARYYTPCVFAAAILIALVPPLTLGRAWHDAIYTALIILVIGCPCALVISTPVTLVSGLAAATRSGILVKGGMFLEQGRLLHWLAIDKTGTITHGTPSQTDFIRQGELDEMRVVSLACSLVSRSDHPVSKAVAQAGQEAGVQLFEVEEFKALPGEGVSGRVDGALWHLGNHKMVEGLHACSKALEEKLFALEKEGRTVVMLAGPKGVEGLFAVADTVRESSIEAVAALRKLGVKTMILTGDNVHTAQAIAKQVGVDEVRAELLPEDKLGIVEELENRGEKVGMVGDGINDTPALARAHIGFAMAKGGTDTAIETADVALMDDDLRKIPRFISLSRSTYAVLMQNISLALIIKAIFFALTLAGCATMWMAVFADVGTSLLVVLNGIRLMRK